MTCEMDLWFPLRFFLGAVWGFKAIFRKKGLKNIENYSSNVLVWSL